MTIFQIVISAAPKQRGRLRPAAPSTNIGACKQRCSNNAQTNNKLRFGAAEMSGPQGLVGGPPGQRSAQHYSLRYPEGVMMRRFRLFPTSSEEVQIGKVMYRGKVRQLRTPVPKVVRAKARIGKAREVGPVTKSLIRELFGD